MMITNKIEDLLKEVLNEQSMPMDEVNVIVSNRKDLADYQFDGAFKLAKIYHKNLLEMASLIAEKLQGNPSFAKVEAMSPGFVNFTLSEKEINENLNKMVNEPLYCIQKPQKETIVIDYG